VSPTPGREFHRKVRTLAGVLQTCINVPRLIGPLPARIWWQLLSHKLLTRLLVPYLLLLAFVANAFLPGSFYRATLLTQALLYALGLTGLMIAGRSRRRRVLAIPATFLWLNAAAVVAAFRYVTGKRLDLWRAAGPDAPQAAVLHHATYDRSPRR